jgi:hypothetical protein
MASYRQVHDIGAGEFGPAISTETVVIYGTVPVKRLD